MARARAIATKSSAAASPPHPRASGRRFRVFRAALAASLLGVPIGLAVTPGASAAPAPIGIFADTLAPTVAVDTDRAPVELGVKFRPQSSGRMTALQYYQGSGARGVTDATVWSARGRVLARVSFPETTKVGWRTVPLANPVGLTAGRTYVVSYHAPRGGYPTIERDLLSAKTLNGFELPTRAGVYTYGSEIAFPTSTYAGTNYLVDIVFQPATPTSTATQQPTQTATQQPNQTATPPPAPTSSGGFVVLGRSFPNSGTTGVPQGTTPTTYTGPCTIQTNNVVIDAKIINCDMRILAQGITITRSIINGTIYSDPDYFNGSFTLTDSEVRMPQSTGTGIGDVNFVVTRVEVTGGSRSINCAANCTVQDSYLHGQYTDRRGIDHESAVRMGSNSVIRHNYITCDATPVPPDSGCSAALTGYGDFAIVQKNTIDNNLIDGGPYGSMGYCAYGGSTKGKPYSVGVNNIKFTNNVFMRGPGGKCGIWGPITSFDSNAPGNVWTNNLWGDGKTVPPAN
jgi:uncharacterized protein DUF4082